MQSADDGVFAMDQCDLRAVAIEGFRRRRFLKYLAFLAATAMVLLVAESVVVQAATHGLDAKPHPPGSDAEWVPPPLASPPPVPPDPKPIPIPPGRVFQAWDNATPTLVPEDVPVTLTDTKTGVAFTTAYGEFEVDNESAYRLTLTENGEPAVSSLFTGLYNGTLLLPSDAKVVQVARDSVTTTYSLLEGGRFVGTMDVTQAFYVRRNKISAVFTPAPDVDGSKVRIAWLGLTSYAIVETAETDDAWLDFDQIEAMDVAKLDLGDLGALSTLEFFTRSIPIRADWESPWRVLMDFSDAKDEWNGTYAGRLSFGDWTGNALLVAFRPGSLAIDPSLIVGSLPSDATKYSIQRKTFFDGERYWAFWYDGTAIRYASSLDGRSWTTASNDMPGATVALTSGFTVANYGRTLAVLWLVPGSPTDRVWITTGQTEGNWIRWDAGQPQWTAVGDTSSPVAATFTSGRELVFTYTSSGRAVLQRLACSATTGSPCSTLFLQAEVYSPDVMSGTPLQALPVAFQGDQGYVAVVYASPTDPLTVFVHGPYGTNPPTDLCVVTPAPGTTIGQSQDPANLIAATPSGGAVSVFWSVYTSSVYKVFHYSVTASCTATPGPNGGVVYSDASYRPSYLTSGGEPDGKAIYLLWAWGNPRKLYYTRVTTGDEPTLPDSPAWLSTFTGVGYLTAAAFSGRYAPVLAMTGTSLYFVNWPLPFDGVASPQNPWGQLLGAPLVGELGGKINPAVGLLVQQTDVVRLGGRQIDTSLSLIYREPGLFYDTSEKIYRYYSPPLFYGKLLGTDSQVLHLDLPWIDAAGTDQSQSSFPMVHLPGGQAFLIEWEGFLLNEFNNMEGIRFTLKHVGSTYTLTFPSGAAYDFDAFGRVAKSYPDATKNNYLQYQYNPTTLLLENVIDNLGREVVLTYGGSNQITQVAYGGGRAVVFDYSGGVPAGCTGTAANSGTIRMTDVLKQDTRFYLCKYRLTRVDLPTGGRIVYAYASSSSGSISQGTDLFTLPILQVDVYSKAGAGTKARSTTFTYHAQNGEIVNAELRFYDGSGVLQGTKEFRYRSLLGLSSTRIVSAAGSQMQQQRNWYSANDQPHYVQTYSGTEAEPSATSVDYVDDWGNVIYSKNALGNETFNSYANTNHQYQFFAPGSLTRTTSGKLYVSSFDTYAHDWTIVSGSPTLSIDDTAFQRYMPSLKLAPTAAGTHTVKRTFTASATLAWDGQVRSSSTTRELDVLLTAPDGTTRAGVQFSTSGRLRYKTSTWADCAWPSVYGGGAINYVANTWYRLTIVADTGTNLFDVYLNGIDACVGKALVGTGSTMDQFRVTLVDSFSAWFDDVKVARGTAITVNGLQPRQSVTLVASNGTTMDRVQTVGGGSATLSLNALSNPTAFQEMGALLLRVYAADGTLQHESPFKEFYGGDSYGYSPPKILADELVKVRSGFGYWTRIEADDAAAGTEYCSPTPCTSAWTWETRPTVSGTRAHLTAYDDPTYVREHGYTGDSTPYVPSSTDFQVQYVYLPASLAPSQILLKYGDGSTWTAASWGVMYDPGPYGTRDMGALPPLRDTWIQLIVSASDAGTSGRTIRAQGYEAVGGSVYWDGSALADASIGRLDVTGVSPLSQTHPVRVSVYRAQDDSLIASALVAVGGDTVAVGLYPTVSAFPVLAKIVIEDGTTGYKYYVGSPQYVWGGDRYRYVGSSGFYDQALPSDGFAASSDIHAFPLGKLTYLGDCLDAVLCFDMESVVPDATIALGSGAVPTKMLDLSGKGNLGTLTGTRFAPISSGASGLGLQFDGLSETIEAGPSTSLNNAQFTVAFWAKPSLLRTQGLVTKNDYTNSWRVFMQGTNGLVEFDAKADTRNLVSLTPLTTQRPTHVAASYDGTTARLYINGVLEASATTGDWGGAYNSKVLIGNTQIGSNYFLAGAIDQVLVYGRALTGNEVRALLEARVPGVAGSFMKPTTSGFVKETRVDSEGRYLVAGYEYDSYGHVVSSTDFGKDAPGANMTRYYYSDFYSGAFPTRIARPDGSEQILSYDRELGAALGAMSPDCRRTRNALDIAGRPVATSSYDSDPDLKLYLDMETPESAASFPTTSKFKDMSCSGNPGTLSTNPPTDAPGVEGRARTFSGASSTYVSVAASSSLDIRGSLTLVAWVNPSTTSGVQRVISKWGDTDAERGYLLSMGDYAAGRIRFQIRTSPGVTRSVDSTTALSTGVWYYIVATYDNSALRIYVDGNLEGTLSAPGSIQGSTAGARIGFEGDGSGSAYFNGGIDEVRIFHKVLNATDVTDLGKLRYKLLGRTVAAFDDMVSTVGSLPFAGYEFHSVTLYDEVSTPRKLYLDMETTIPRPPIGGGDINLEDLSGSGNHAVTSVAGSAPGKLGQALFFDPIESGSTGLIVSDPSKLNFVEEFTIAGWFDLTDNNNRWAVYKWGPTDASRSWLLKPADSTHKPAVYIHGAGTTSDSLSGTSNAPTGVWRFLAATFDRGAVTLYVDSGTSLTTFSKVSTVKRIQATNTVVTLGNLMYGGIDELQMFDRALTAAEIQNLYDSVKTPGASSVKDKSHVQKTYFDGLGRETRDVLRDMYGSKIETKADLTWQDLVLRAYLPSGQYSSFTYDFLGRRLTSTTPGDASTAGTTTWTYTNEQRKVEVVDPVGRKVYERFDVLGRTIETGAWNPFNSTYNVTRTAYNAIGGAVREDVILPSGAKQQATASVYYNLNGLVRFAIYPNGKTASSYYDDNLRAAAQVDEMGRAFVLVYDSLGRVAQSAAKPSLGSGTSYPTTYLYDSGGNLQTIQNGSTSLVYRQYDGRHRLLNESFQMPAAPPTSNLPVVYGYDAAGKVTRVDYVSSANRVTYTYDSLGRVMQLNAAFGGSSAKYAEIGYDAYDRLTGVWLWDAGTNTTLVRRYTYDVRDRATQVKVYAGTTTYLMLNYTYNKASDVVHIDDTATTNGAKAHDYVYDAQGRLLQGKGPWPSDESIQAITYTYDAVGNIKTQNVQYVGTTTYVYNYGAWNRLEQLTGAIAETYSYNDAGSLLEKNVAGARTTHTYDYDQQLVQTVLPNGTKYDYSVDGLGRRLKVVETVGASSSTTYFAYSGGTVLFTRKGATDTIYVYLNGQLFMRKTTGEAVRMYHADLSNNVRLVTYYSGGTQVDYRFRYRPFGEVTTLSAGGGAKDPRFKFAGQELDPTGLYHMGARYEDPRIGRFTSRDPIGPGYAYAVDNPVSFYDPTGLSEFLYPFYPGVGYAVPPPLHPPVNPLQVWTEKFLEFIQPAVDAWNSLPPEWRAVITVAATVVLIVATAGAGAALVGASWTTFAAAGVLAATASAVAWVALGIASGKVRTAEQAWDTLAGGFVAGATIFGILTTLYGVGKGLLEAEARGSMAGANGGVPIKGRTAVIGERMSRVRAFAGEYGYETMPNLPRSMPTAEKLAANRAWIRARMDEGYTIVDLGPAPGYANYPYITSPYYRMELEQILGRGYGGWLPIWGAF